MDFKDISSDVQNKIVDILNNHIISIVEILKHDKFLNPMMRINPIEGRDTLISLVREDGSIDVDDALKVSVNKIKNMEINFAIYSYSTKIGVNPNVIMDAVKTFIFLNDGLTVSFYTPYEVKGLFKKTINVEKSLLAGVIENIYEVENYENL